MFEILTAGNEVDKIVYWYNLPRIQSPMLLEQIALQAISNAILKIFNGYHEHDHQFFLSTRLKFEPTAIIDLITEQVLTEAYMSLEEDGDDQTIPAMEAFEYMSNNVDYFTSRARYLVHNFYFQIYLDCEFKVKTAQVHGVPITNVVFSRSMSQPDTLEVTWYMDKMTCKEV